MSEIGRLVEGFVTQVTALVESETIARARTAVAAAFGQRPPGRPSKALSFTRTGRGRKTPPVQLCPVPGCKNPAAPIFGMVCAEHKDVPKRKIKKYREARKAAKANSSAKPRTATRKPRPSIRRKAAEGAKRSARKRSGTRPKAVRKSAPRAAKKKAPHKAANAAPASPTPAAAAPAA